MKIENNPIIIYIKDFVAVVAEIKFLKKISGK